MPRRAADSELNRAIGARLREVREGRGLTQAQLAEKVGMNPESISRVETGARALSVQTLMLIARALEVPPGRLLELGPPFTVGTSAGRDEELQRIWDGLNPEERKIGLRVLAALGAAGRT